MLKKIKAILRGIDETETESEYGWWETSAGADFGRKKLLEINTLFIAAASQSGVEVDLIATPFIPRKIGEELALCQRYYQKGYAHAVDAEKLSRPDHDNYCGGVMNIDDW